MYLCKYKCTVCFEFPGRHTRSCSINMSRTSFLGLLSSIWKKTFTGSIPTCCTYHCHLIGAVLLLISHFVVLRYILWYHIIDCLISKNSNTTNYRFGNITNKNTDITKSAFWYAKMCIILWYQYFYLVTSLYTFLMPLNRFCDTTYRSVMSLMHSYLAISRNPFWDITNGIRI